MNAKIEFSVMENGKKRFLPLSDFATGARFSFTSQNGIKRGFKNALKRMNNTLHFNFGSTEVFCEAYLIDENGRKTNDKPIATAYFKPQFIF